MVFVVEKSKQEEDVASGMIERLNKMGKKNIYFTQMMKAH